MRHTCYLVCSDKVLALLDWSQQAADIWSGSKIEVKRKILGAISLNRTICVVVNDEVDKFEEWAGPEPDAVSRTFKRLRSYGDRGRQINVSTPTSSSGKINELFLASDVRLWFFCPCPACGKYQRLVFPQLRWPRPEGLSGKELAAFIARHDSIWYECIHCGRKILPGEKAAMVRAGRWSNETMAVEDNAGEKHPFADEVEEFPPSTRLGFQISALYCLWSKWSDVAAEFIRAEGKIGPAYNFRTETLGEPFENQVARLGEGIFTRLSRKSGLAEGIVPAWGWCLIATIDTQADHFYCVVRAWGGGMKSARVWHGRLLTFEELDQLILVKNWPLDPAVWPDCPPLKINLALIDTGGGSNEDAGMTRTMEVYRWVLPRQAVVRAIKGASREGPALFWPMKDLADSAHSLRNRRRAPDGLLGFIVDSHRCADLLDDAIRAGGSGANQGPPSPASSDNPVPAEEETWLLNARDDAEYNRHLANEHKTAVRWQGRIIDRWQPVYPGARHDYRDCEKYQFAAAYMARVHLLPGESELMEIRRKTFENLKSPPRPSRQTQKDYDPWQPRPI